MEPYDATLSPEREPPRGGDTTKVLLIVAAIGGLSLLVCCGVGVWFAFFLGDDIIAEQVAADLRDNPVMQEHIGEIESIEMDWGASMAAPGENEFVFHVRGTKGTGTITADCITVSEGEEDVVAGHLEMDDGTTYDLFPDEP